MICFLDFQSDCGYRWQSQSQWESSSLTTSQQQQQRQQMKLKLKKSAHIPVLKMCNAIKSIASGLKAQLTDWDYVEPEQEQEQHHGGHILPRRLPLTRVSAEASALCTVPPTLCTPVYLYIYIYIYILYIWLSWSSIRRLSTTFHSLFHWGYRNWHFVWSVVNKFR